MTKIILTGPECSGKTTLCKKISRHFKIDYNPEKSREYLEKINRDYCKEDLLTISKQQIVSEKKFQILDTDLLTIKIWSEYKYGHCDKWITEKIKWQKKEKRFYLLCKPDIPWVYDMQRENPNEREELFKIYENLLNKIGHEYYTVEGKNRLKKCILKISKFFS